MASSFSSSFSRCLKERDGAGLFSLIKDATTNAQVGKSSADTASDPVAADVLRALRCSNSKVQKTNATNDVSGARLEASCSALKRWVKQYEEAPAPATWMIPPCLALCYLARRTAIELDAGVGKSDETKHLKKVVEILRELFQRLNRDREKREGCLVVCAELLRLYFRLGQASQCSFLLAAVAHAQKGEQFQPAKLPKALGVTLCYFWGKHCVFDQRVTEAEAKLGWAFDNCPYHRQRRRILVLLVPCRLRLGKSPSQELLKKYGLGSLSELVKAVSSGNVKLFNSQVETLEDELIRNGTYLVVERLKLVVYRNLCRRVHRIVGSTLESSGKHKQPLEPYEKALLWQDGCDQDECACILANLIFLNGIKGYISDEHRKIVFSKDTPFPPLGSWKA